MGGPTDTDTDEVADCTDCARDSEGGGAASAPLGCKSCAAEVGGGEVEKGKDEEADEQGEPGVAAAAAAAAVPAGGVAGVGGVVDVDVVTDACPGFCVDVDVDVAADAGTAGGGGDKPASVAAGSTTPAIKDGRRAATWRSWSFGSSTEGAWTRAAITWKRDS